MKAGTLLIIAGFFLLWMALAARAETKINCEPDQSGKLNNCWEGDPPPYPCDPKTNYCPSPKAPVYGGY